MKWQLQRPARSDLRLMLLYWLLAAPIISYSNTRSYGFARAGLGELHHLA